MHQKRLKKGSWKRKSQPPRKLQKDWVTVPTSKDRLVVQPFAEKWAQSEKEKVTNFFKMLMESFFRWRILGVSEQKSSETHLWKVTTQKSMWLTLKMVQSWMEGNLELPTFQIIGNTISWWSASWITSHGGSTPAAPRTGFIIVSKMMSLGKF